MTNKNKKKIEINLTEEQAWTLATLLADGEEEHIRILKDRRVLRRSDGKLVKRNLFENEKDLLLELKRIRTIIKKLNIYLDLLL